MRGAVMTKYEGGKTLKLKKAGSQWACEACGAVIKKGTEYFRESLGPVSKPPGLHLVSFCFSCGGAWRNDLVNAATDHRRGR